MKLTHPTLLLVSTPIGPQHYPVGHESDDEHESAAHTPRGVSGRLLEAGTAGPTVIRGLFAELEEVLSGRLLVGLRLAGSASKFDACP
jgi:hypothetical protein